MPETLSSGRLYELSQRPLETNIPRELIIGCDISAAGTVTDDGNNASENTEKDVRDGSWCILK